MSDQPNTLPWYQLLHLADSALPTGGFAFSSGLESSARLGLIRDMADLDDFLTIAIRQARQAELPFVFAGHAAITTGDAAIVALVKRYDAWLLTPTIRRGSLTQGRAWLTLAPCIFPDHDWQSLRQLLATRALPTHLAPVFGLIMGQLHVDTERVQALFLYACIRDLTSAAIRLGLLGPQEGHALLARFCQSPEFTEPVPTMDAAYRTAPLLEIAQSKHNDLYTKLFQS